KSFTDQGFEVVHLDISSELSSTFSTACLEAERLPGVYPVDSRMLSTGVGLLALEGADCRDKGMAAREIAEHLESLTEKVSTSFVLDTLAFMWKGGRCSGVTALGANLLKLKPALRMQEGKLEVFKKYRGKIENVYKQYVSELLEGKKIRPGHIFITDSGEVEQEVIDELTEMVRSLSGCREVHHTLAGCTVSTHCGPKTLGVLFIEE
ncbi:MAG: DegV family EDD domain-containing protein, partial [Lachnospiraceae bacterium]|nr:DegV family EDD domain-containing protein [Lachnospiraceae bacterium]